MVGLRVTKELRARRALFVLESEAGDELNNELDLDDDAASEDENKEVEKKKGSVEDKDEDGSMT
jgi:hypothetical protein